ncbi:hypothetical protein AGABI1DRAFT_32708 [Agaricus bisporus var. burnettii JB137-S8]|uniref:tRNA (guanine(37)-N1)-methyltransferase n=1 Tax=Agaricus bisporus var. burnettii (strain JB137-S8 / ATCC MYA-4627 / FGSC 10392) TaxID=597362 RepID=K5Y795_AGABU|nr:uncharacterized protein AGABI1DRAFT_32708 [Agaricus bisporus var. burnettii JB137-S8]EKM84070.1 hypothetical protein AGABI1DRAFT_32708 [Agaricus bisporus var. burnettii JB137-S8]
MSSRVFLDASPPSYQGPKDRLDKSAFHKTLTVLSARVPPNKTGQLLKARELKGALMDLPKIRSVVSDPENPNGSRLVLLRTVKYSELPPVAQEYLGKETQGLVNHEIKLDYDYWSTDDILQTILPGQLREGAPSGFAMTGHIAHVNLLEEYLPYKYLIGQLILDKNKKVRTVVNKLDSIHAQFRVFEMELIAGDPDYIVEHHESDCRFTFDFSQVYWNSRLHTEHERLVRMFEPDDVVADVFAGVGPFAIPSARKGCAVLANDLNPASHKYLEKNVADNGVSDRVRTFCEDGREFIQTIAKQLHDDPLPPFNGPALSRTRREKERRRARLQHIADATPNPVAKSRKRICHFIMNLPDTAILFLNAFRGMLKADEDDNLLDTYEVMPMIHCHCFTREMDPEKAEVDIRKRVEEQLGAPLEEDVTFHLVRSVAPNKEMYCISFRLPRAVGIGR